ncbi:hypothetical protein TNCV_2798931 [Trichonephila clavipes]|nr:hypothetical protein TNCV_2798931 [Trichonephila clavipes]
MCSWGTAETKQLPHVAKVDMVWQVGAQAGQYVSGVVTHYPVEIWLWSSPEGKEGQLAPTFRRCSAGCLKYRQYVVEEYESDIQYHSVP